MAMRAPEVAPQPHSFNPDNISLLPASPQADNVLFTLGIRRAIRERSNFVDQAIREAKRNREAGFPISFGEMRWNINPPALDNPVDGIYGPSPEEADLLNDPNYKPHPLTESVREFLTNPKTMRVASGLTAAVTLAVPTAMAIDSLIHPSTVWAQTDSNPDLNNPPQSELGGLTAADIDPTTPVDQQVIAPAESDVEPAQDQQPVVETPPAPEPTVEATVVFNFDSGVPDSDRRIVTNGVYGLKRYLANTYGIELSRTLFVNVGPEALFQLTLRGNQIMIDPRNPEWVMSSDKIREKIVRHETYHFYQALTMNTLDTLSPGPTWLGEGSAEYVAFRSMANDGIFSYNEGRALWVWNLYFGSSLPSLNLLESQQQWMSVQGPTYSEAALAVEQLVSKRGDASLNTYFQLLGQGVFWQDAFQQSFGVTSDTFYQQFQQFRRNLPKPTGNTPRL